jgi:hypothetical protein
MHACQEYREFSVIFLSKQEEIFFLVLSNSGLVAPWRITVADVFVNRHGQFAKNGGLKW